MTQKTTKFSRMAKVFSSLSLVIALVTFSLSFTSCSKDAGPTTFTVTFNSNGGSAVQSATVESGQKVTKPADPAKADNVFAGWYKDETLTTAWIFETDAVTANIMLYAKWTDPTTIDEGVVINGVKWATRNVDAFGHFAATPEALGKIYQWNRPTAWAATGTVTDWDVTAITGNSWEAANDPSPAGWRVPTGYEIQSLLDATKVDNAWVTTPVNGQLFTDKATSATLFLPAAGYRYDGTLYGAGTIGYYWGSTANGTTSAYYLSFGSVSAGWDYDARTYGFSVRSVAE